MRGIAPHPPCGGRAEAAQRDPATARSRRSGSAVVALVSLVSTRPGAMPLTRMPSSAHASPRVRVKPDRAGLRGVVGRIAHGGMVGRGRTDDDQRALAPLSMGWNFRARHQAHQVDVEHLAKALHREFAAPVDDGALRQHQHVEPRKGRLPRSTAAKSERRSAHSGAREIGAFCRISRPRSPACPTRARRHPWRGRLARCRCRCRSSRRPPAPACR